MQPITNQIANSQREAECTGITLERKYFAIDNSFVKRSLRPSEWQLNAIEGTLHIPRFGNERLLNEAATLRFISENTNIPVPKLHCSFQDADAVYLITEYIEGVTMDRLSAAQRKIVEVELEDHVETLSNLKSNVWGGPTGIVIPPYRIMMKSPRPEWKMKTRDTKDLVFCHNNLSTYNVIVDPSTLKIQAIIGWEHAGFFPQEFECLYFYRPGPSFAIRDEPNDENRLLGIVNENMEMTCNEGD